MRTVEFTIKTDKGTAKVSEMDARVRLPETLDEAVEWVGAEKVLGIFLAKAVIIFQDKCRQALIKGLEPEKIKELIPETWKPTQSIRIVGMREITQDQALETLAKSGDPLTAAAQLLVKLGHFKDIERAKEFVIQSADK